MRNYYIMFFNDGKDIKVGNKRSLFEMWNCSGRWQEVSFIDYHMFDTDASGNIKEYVYAVDRISRRTLQSGEIKYSVRLGKEKTDWLA